MIRFEKVSKTFETSAGNVHALCEIDLDIEKGCIFGVIGSSGAGKSTLLRAITGIYHPDSGKIIAHGNISPLLSIVCFIFSSSKQITLQVESSFKIKLKSAALLSIVILLNSSFNS